MTFPAIPELTSPLPAAAVSTANRSAEGEEHRQMWRAGELRALVPDEVDSLLADALRAAGAWAGNVRIAGTAPNGLTFTLGEREVAAVRALSPAR